MEWALSAYFPFFLLILIALNFIKWVRCAVQNSIFFVKEAEKVPV